MKIAVTTSCLVAVILVAVGVAGASQRATTTAATATEEEMVEPVYLTPEQMANLRAQQGNVAALQHTLTNQAHYLQGQWGHLQHLDHNLATRDQALLAQQHALQLQLQRQQQQHLAVQHQQALMMNMQNRVYHEQQAVLGVHNQLNMLTHPQAHQQLLTNGAHGAHGAHHAQPTVLHNGMPIGASDMHKLPGMARPFDGKFKAGRFKLSGKTINSASREMTIVPSIIVVLHSDGTMTGTCEYLASRKYAATTVDVAGSWTESTLTWTEYYHGKTYTYRTKVGENKRLTGSYSWPISGHGTVDFKVEVWDLSASGMQVPVGFFAALPDVKRVPYPETPVKGQFTAGYYKVTGKTINDATQHVTIAPTIVMHFDSKNNALRGMAEYLASRSHDAATVRLVGKWGPNSIDYSETYFGKTFTFKGRMQPDRPGFVRGKYTYSGSHGQQMQGSFEYTFVRISYMPVNPHMMLHSQQALLMNNNPHLVNAHLNNRVHVAAAGNVYNTYARVQ
eukprot:TRINITY_DN115441_c0_g1_i1.p1 TRINITY_DN115441_c0_g1~~TRINITY_DN115441_c0_g1_i1.p1  ORF type:complete len:506 (+),score=297.64 TRINITY_DN115441_c0_g1_i1:2-1519(+)